MECVPKALEGFIVHVVYFGPFLHVFMSFMYQYIKFKLERVSLVCVALCVWLTAPSQLKSQVLSYVAQVMCLHLEQGPSTDSLFMLQYKGPT